jgi:CDP-2,3-bis-(O-geranylgeranyl)-sn-glycerol synthase
MEIIWSFLWAFYFFLPAGVANMAPVLVKKVNFLNVPVDFGLKLGGKRFFGAHKTYRGFLFGILVAMFIVYLQKIVYGFYQFGFFNYNSVNIFLLGFLLGFGALFGDLIKSFFKRRAGIKSGRSWFPFDQVDWVIGAFLFVVLCYSIPLNYFLAALILFLMLHPLTNYIGYLLKIKENKF